MYYSGEEESDIPDAAYIRRLSKATWCSVYNDLWNQINTTIT